MYCWKTEKWPSFSFDRLALSSLANRIQPTLATLRNQVVQLTERDRRIYALEILILEAKNTSSIEGEYFSNEDLRSSITNSWAITGHGNSIKDPRAVGIGKLMRIVADDFSVPITESILKYWHSILFESNKTLRSIGEYRLGPEPMRIMSGPLLNPTIHYEAPPAESVLNEMKGFIETINRSYSEDPLISGFLNAGVNHFYFESIHPFEDGNGRIGRALIDFQLSRTIGMPIPFSVSQAFQLHQGAYYSALNGSRSDLDITGWLTFYLERVLEAITLAKDQVSFILKKTRLFDRIENQISASQEKALRRLVESGPEGFEGGLSAKKYMCITRVSRATATRELSHLTRLGALTRTGAGRSVRYQLNLDEIQEEE